MFIVGAGTLRYGDIVAVIDAAKGAGVEKVGIVTEGMRRAAGAATRVTSDAGLSNGRLDLDRSGRLLVVYAADHRGRAPPQRLARPPSARVRLASASAERRSVASMAHHAVE